MAAAPFLHSRKEELRMAIGIKDIFLQHFGGEPDVCAFAPGRVNLIGEHTDYNGGYALPCALNLGITGAARLRDDKTLRLYSANFPDGGITEISLSSPLAGGWTDYPVSVIRTFAAMGYSIDRGADIAFSGNLPDGSGLSSSAALEVLTGLLLRELYGFSVTAQELAVFGQLAENRFIGVNCGIMDQFASAMGKSGHAILLDAHTLSFRYAPLGNAAVVIVNSGVRHSLSSSAYNDRRRECETALKALQVSNLCSLSPEKLEERSKMLTDEVCYRRARHAISENQRALEAAQALLDGDLTLFGKLMSASHASLRDDYEVSCEELDFLAKTAQRIKGVYGARMTGGGFGGCTVNLLEPEEVGRFVTAVQAAYHERFGRIPEIYHVSAGDGAVIIDE